MSYDELKQERRPHGRIGLYGGSFDPIHNGHLILARDALEELNLDIVIFIPAFLSPHKGQHPPAPAEARWEMVLAAIGDEPGFAADDIELRRGGVSYTITTVFDYKVRFPEAELFYFIGEDNLHEIHTWYRFEELVRLVRLVLLSREGNMGGLPKGEGNLELLGEVPRISRKISISSSEIRKRIAMGKSIRYLMPEKAVEVLYRYGLYADREACRFS
ncbi:MAG: nicotinate-nucleotide adenylyltransferase [Chthoniobacterales bacterium]|nr:nicotinate-nucleotide adenylyltransferase [Chthoniobacterales bacterium]